MKIYQNTLQAQNASTFVEVGEYSGAEIKFSAKSPTVKVGNQTVKFAKASVSLRVPTEITSCDKDSTCVIGTVTESVSIDFNVIDTASLDVLQAELLRVFTLTRERLSNGVVPPVYSDFAQE